MVARFALGREAKAVWRCPGLPFPQIGPGHVGQGSPARALEGSRIPKTWHADRIDLKVACPVTMVANRAKSVAHPAAWPFGNEELAQRCPRQHQMPSKAPLWRVAARVRWRKIATIAALSIRRAGKQTNGSNDRLE